jgi:hypothetical protein
MDSQSDDIVAETRNKACPQHSAQRPNPERRKTVTKNTSTPYPVLAPSESHYLVLVLLMLVLVLVLVLRLRLILHALVAHSPRLSQQRRLPLRLAELSLFILLTQIARPAAERAHAVAAATPLEPVLGAHVAAVDHGQDERDAHAREGAEGGAASVATRVAVHVAVVARPVPCAPVQDARTPP